MEDETKTHSLDLTRRRIDRTQFNLPCLVIVAGPSLGEKFPLTQERIIIGRHREAEIWINDESISRKHAEVISKENRLFLRDLGSKNGTYSNDRKIVEIELKDGDLIRIGDATLKFLGPNNVEQFYLDALSERAKRDSLTGLFNKQTFHTCLERIFVRCRDLGEPLSVAMIDLDWFKRINDQWGHPAGDFVLKEFSNLIKPGIRPTDLLARWGGEEFGLILPHTTVKEAAIAAERIRSRVAGHPFLFEENRLPVTISIGLAERTEGDTKMEPLIARADKALYQAKQEGRNRTCCLS
ncbi:MAG: GGDEF domain-containing protein [Candidatus Manganitrophaceae bacterium]|nr:MAG: GGDEF domain-containing protein [Candidatus Manganitrophaceae bacterium]